MQHRLEGLLAMDSDLRPFEDSSLVLGKARKRYADIETLEQASSDLFPNTFGKMIADDGIIMRRTVKSSNGEGIPFIEWLYHNIVVKANSTVSLASEQRCFLLTGRAGQGKSTLCRKLFLHLKDQTAKVSDKIRPHYLEQHDVKIKEFFKKIHSKTTYVQARSLSSDVAEHKPDGTAKLIIVDGLDEIAEDQIDGALDNIVKMIETQQEALFLFSSRSRQHSGDGKDETIYLKDLKKKMKNANLNQNLDGQIVSVGDLTLSEKRSMFGLLNETIKEDSPRLGRLVENDSDYLQRPADFHIMKNKAIKNGVQYYLETTRWLLRREMGKDDSERKEYVRHLNFESLLDGTFDFEQQRYNLGKLEDDTHFLKTMRTFNLIEVDGGTYYLDLTVPSSLGMLLCMFSDIKVDQFVDEDYSSNDYMFEKPKDQKRCQKLKDMFEHVVEHRDLNEHTPTSTYRFSTTLLNGSTVEYRNEVLDLLRSKFELTDNLKNKEKLKLGQLSDPITKQNSVLTNMVKLCIFITDVLHPEDEMGVDGYAVEFDSAHRDRIGNLIYEIEYLFWHDKDGATHFENIVDDLVDGSETFSLSDFEPFEDMLRLYLVLYSRICYVGPGYEASDKLTGNNKPPVSLEESYLDALEFPIIVTKLFKILAEVEGVKTVLRLDISERFNQLIVRGLEHLDKKSSHSRKRLFQSMCHHLISSNQPSHDIVVKRIVPHLLKHCALPSGIKIDSFLKPGREKMIVKWWTLIGDLGSENSNNVIEYFANIGLATNFLPANDFDDSRKAAMFLHQLEEQTNSEYLKSLVKAFVLISRIGHLEHFATTPEDHINDWKLLELDKNIVPQETAFRGHSHLRFEEWVEQIIESGTDSLFCNISPQFRPLFMVQFLDETSLTLMGGDAWVKKYLEPLREELATQTFREQILIWIKNGDFFAALILAIRTGAVDIVSILTQCEMESGGHATLKKQIVGRYLNRSRKSDSLPPPDASEKDFWTNLFSKSLALERWREPDYLTIPTAKYFFAKFTAVSDIWQKNCFNTEITWEACEHIESSNIAVIQNCLFYKLEDKWILFMDENEKTVTITGEHLEQIADSKNDDAGETPISMFESIAPTIEHPLYFYAILDENGFQPETAIFGIDEEISNLRLRYDGTVGKIEQIKHSQIGINRDCWICGNLTVIKYVDDSKKVGTFCESCGLIGTIYHESRWVKLPLLKFYNSIKDGHHLRRLQGKAHSKFERDIMNRAVVPFIVLSRLKRKIPNVSVDDKSDLENFIDYVWGDQKRFLEEFPRLYSPSTLMQSLTFGNDYAITSWHMPKEFHNPQTLQPPHRGFLEHLLQDPLLLSGVQSHMSRTLNPKRPLQLWDNIEVFQCRIQQNKKLKYQNIPREHADIWAETKNRSIRITSSKGAYNLMLSPELVDYHKSEESEETEKETHVSDFKKMGHTLDHNLMPATLRSLSTKFDYGEEEIDSNHPIQLGLTEIAGAQLSGIHGIGGIPDYISILHFSGFLVKISKNYHTGHKSMFVNCLNTEDPLEGIIEIIDQRFTGKKTKPTITSFVEFNTSYQELPLYASSGWKEELLKCDNINEELNLHKRLVDGSRTIRTWGIITDDGDIDEFKLVRIQEKIAAVENNLQQFTDNQRVSQGRTNLLNLIKDVMTTFSEIEWSLNHKEEFDIIAKKIRALFTNIKEAEKIIRGENSKGTTQDLDTLDTILTGLENQYQRSCNSYDLKVKKFNDDLQSTDFNMNHHKENLKKLAYHFDSQSLEKIVDTSPLSSDNKRMLQKYCQFRKKLKIRVLGLSRKNYPSELESHWDEVLGSLVGEKPIEIGSLVRFDIKIVVRAGVKSLLVTNILLAKDELCADGTLIPELDIPPDKVPSPLPANTWLEVNADKEAIKKDVHPSFNLNMFIKPGKLYAFHPALDVEVPIFNTGKVKNDWIGRMCQCEIEIRRDRRKGIFRYYVVEIKS